MEKLLFEIGTEEIPAKFMPGILAQLKELAEKKMTELRIPFEGVRVLGTPRRMTFIADGVAETQADTVVEAKVPLRTNRLQGRRSNQSCSRLCPWSGR